MKIVFHTALFPSLRQEWGRMQMLGFGYLAAWLRRTHPEIEIRLAETEEELLSARPDLVGLTCVTYTYGWARRLARRLREQTGARVVLGGPHLTALPERMDAEFDYGVLGEGEQTFVALIDRLLQPGAPEGLAAIDGLVYWRDGQRVINPRRELIEPLDQVPWPDRDLCGDAAGLRRGSVSLMTSRGCPYDCAFCATTTHWQRLRAHSAEYVLAEVDEVLRRWRPWQIVFEDDLFIANRRRFEAIAEGLLARGAPRRVQFHVSGRANLITDEVCALLRAINARSIFMGLESASNTSLATLGKRAITAETNQRALDTLRRHGIRVAASFILGTPGETFADLVETYNFVQRNLDVLDRVDAGVLRLLPGTAFWDEGLKRGLIDEPMTGIVFDERDVTDGWYSLNQRYPMLCTTMTRNELLAMYLAFKELSATVYARGQGAQGIETLGCRRIATHLAGRLARRFGLGPRA